MHRPTVVACVLFLAAVAVPVSGNGSRITTSLQLDLTSLSAPPDAQGLHTTEQAVRGIAAVMSKSLGLAVPDRVTVFIYPGRRAFEQGLIQDAQLSPMLAAKVSDYAIGVGMRGQVLLNEQPHNREWLRLIAHELTHVSQIELAGGEARGEQWLAEGMAEWVAFVTLERLGLDALDRRRLQALTAVRSHATLLGGRLDLEARGTSRGFSAWHARQGTVPTYQLAFLLADTLIERRGLERMTSYFASFKGSHDRRANFRRAFGSSIAEFEADALGRLKAESALRDTVSAP